MSDYKVGDVVVVVDVPKEGHYPQVQGEGGFVSEVHEGDSAGWVRVQLLKDDGSMSATGSLPSGCVKKSSDPRHHRAKRVYDEWFEKYNAEALARTARRRTYEKEVAEKYGVPVETALAIANELDTDRFHRVFYAEWAKEGKRPCPGAPGSRS